MYQSGSLSWLKREVQKKSLIVEASWVDFQLLGVLLATESFRLRECCLTYDILLPLVCAFIGDVYYCFDSVAFKLRRDSHITHLLLKKYCFNWLCAHWIFFSWVMLQVLRLLYNQSFMSLVALILDNRTCIVCIYKIINFRFKIQFLSWSLIGTNNYLPTLKIICHSNCLETLAPQFLLFFPVW